MDRFSNGVMSIINGAFRAVSELTSPVGLCVGVSAVCLLWLSLIELHELDRMGTKPSVQQH
jgi:hypothetical protein